jgi:hypothetical protein
MTSIRWDLKFALAPLSEQRHEPISTTTDGCSMTAMHTISSAGTQAYRRYPHHCTVLVISIRTTARFCGKQYAVSALFVKWHVI